MQTGHMGYLLVVNAGMGSLAHWRQIRADFDHSARHARAASRPVERSIKVRDIDDEEAAELFLGVGKRAVLHQPLLAAKLQRGCGFRWLKSGATHKDARVLERL